MEHEKNMIRGTSKLIVSKLFLNNIQYKITHITNVAQYPKMKTVVKLKRVFIYF